MFIAIYIIALLAFGFLSDDIGRISERPYLGVILTIIVASSFILWNQLKIRALLEDKEKDKENGNEDEAEKLN